METSTIYRCNKKCPLNKHCFVLKVPGQLKQPLPVLVKCVAAKGKDVPIVIGERPP